jgi:Flp pilus assembly protein CpaB
MSRKRGGLILLVLGVVIAVGVASFVFQQAQRAAERDIQQSVEVLVASQDIPERTLVTAPFLTTKRMLPTSLPPAAMVRPEEAVGKMTTGPILAGDFIMPAKLAEADGRAGLSFTLPKGKVVITLPASDILSTGAVRAGDHVDLLVTIKPSEQKADPLAPPADGDKAKPAAQPQPTATPVSDLPAVTTQMTMQNLRVLAIGAVLYWATMKLLASSGNPNFAPTVIMLGAFLIPVAYVTYLYESAALDDLPIPTLALTFFYGGVLGSIAAQLLEQRLVTGAPPIAALAIGFSEEIAKPLGVLWVARRSELTASRYGFILGAAAGMGFAAFETMGYGFTFLIASRGSLDVLGEVLLTRGLLSPMAHGAWTALVVGVFWREGKRLTWGVLLAFTVAVMLHAFWNYASGAIPIELAIPGVELRWRSLNLAIPELSLPLPEMLVGALGLWILRRVSRPRPCARAVRA